MSKILVVDDEPHLRRALSINLKARSYEVIEAATGEEALTAVATSNPELVLLDLGLPGISGLDVIEGLRAWSTVPIIVLTVRDDQRSKVRALDLGADDYVTKPFGMEELFARMRVALRRNRPLDEELAKIQTDAWTLDFVSHTIVSTAGEPIHMTPTEWSIVEYLARYPHRLITQRNLLDAVWGPTFTPDANLLRVHLAHIRRKLEVDPAQPRHFITEAGLGFRFEP
jgi:two-component system, OmpR family, KDP operon response regulator KdpE